MRSRLLAPLLSLLLGVVPSVALGQDSPRSDEAPPIDAGLLRTASLDLLGRPPLQVERERWLGASFSDYLTEVLGGEAFWRSWCEEQLYYFLLIDNFRPADEAVDALVEGLGSGTYSARDALFRTVGSSAFDRRNPGPDTFVSVVMEQLLGRTVQKNPGELEIGKALYDGRPGRFLGETGESQSDVLRIAIQHKDFYRALLSREYERLLHAEPQRRALLGWARRLERNPHAFPALLREWLLSTDYRERLARPRPLSNRTFVRALFVDLAERLPDAAEARRMRNALDGLSDPGPLRSVLARLLLDSGSTTVPAREAIEDPTAWIQELFSRLLGREPSSEELVAFLEVFHDPASRPTTLVYAVVSDPGYQQY